MSIHTDFIHATPRHATLRRTAWLALCSTFILTLQGCCGVCGAGQGEEIEEYCFKQVTLAHDDRLFVDKKKCKEDMKLMSKEKPKVFECMLTCSKEQADTYEVTSKCNRDCIQNDGRASLKTLTKAKPVALGAQVEVKTAPGASVKITVKSTKDKAFSKVVKDKADKEGLAQVEVLGLEEGRYEALVETKQGDLSGKSTVSFNVKQFSLYLNSKPLKGKEKQSLYCHMVLTAGEKSIAVYNRSRKLVFDAKGRSEVSFNLPQTRAFKVGDKKVKPKKDWIRFKVDLSKLSGGNTAFKMFDDVRGEVPVALDHKLMGKYEGKVSCSLEKARTFREGRPYTFKGDRSSRAGKGIAVVVEKQKVKRVVGASKDAPARDVDFVAVASKKFTTSGSCPYFNPNTGTRKSIKKSRTDISMTIYDRRSGEKVKSKTFKGGRASCPSKLDATRTTVFGSSPSQATIDRWLESTVAKLR